MTQLKLKDQSPRARVWPAIFLLAVLALIWFMAANADNMLEAAGILFVVLVAAAIFQRITYHLRGGKPRLTKISRPD
jgi:hypothetical protein